MAPLPVKPFDGVRVYFQCSARAHTRTHAHSYTLRTLAPVRAKTRSRGTGCKPACLCSSRQQKDCSNCSLSAHIQGRTGDAGWACMHTDVYLRRFSTMVVIPETPSPRKTTFATSIAKLSRGYVRNIHHKEHTKYTSAARELSSTRVWHSTRSKLPQAELESRNYSVPKSYTKHAAGALSRKPSSRKRGIVDHPRRGSGPKSCKTLTSCFFFAVMQPLPTNFNQANHPYKPGFMNLRHGLQTVGAAKRSLAR